MHLATCFDYTLPGGEWRWSAIARNNEVIGDSSEGYTRHADAIRAVQGLFTPDVRIVEDEAA